jgi:hypothetical protein
MSDQIFLLNDNGALVTLEATDYPAEAVLQQLLARYPGLLPGGQPDETGAAPWLLVTREASIPDDSLAERFALDHLFLDREGVPTLVEVKRASDTRARREVVAQMLDYASHFVVHWTAERIKSEFAESCLREDVDPADCLQAFLHQTADDEFWQAVKTNLLAGRIRMMFVADRISPELRRIVEFLNNQMDPAEVLAVEIPQYTGQGFSTFVPRLVGQSAAAQERKSRASSEPKRKWDEESFLVAAEQIRGLSARETADTILAWAHNLGLDVWGGQGAKTPSLSIKFSFGNAVYSLFVLYANPKSVTVEVQFRSIRIRTPFSDETMRQNLLARLNLIDGVVLPSDSFDSRPSIYIDVFHQNPQRLEQFLAVWDWYLDEVRKANMP